MVSEMPNDEGDRQPDAYDVNDNRSDCGID
jgi:hypothetical protein